MFVFLVSEAIITTSVWGFDSLVNLIRQFFGGSRGSKYTFKTNNTYWVSVTVLGNMTAF